MIVEVVKGDALGKETVERHVDVRSVDLPRSRGMVRLEDVVDILLEDDDVPRHAIEELKQQIDDDPSTGGHIGIHAPSSSAYTALFERVEIYAEDVHEARGSSTCGPDETWLKTVISKELDERIYEAIHEWPHVDLYNRSALVEEAVGEYLDESSERPTAEDLEDADEGELVAELERRGYDVPAREITADGGGD